MEFSEDHRYNEYIQLQTNKSGIIISNIRVITVYDVIFF